MKHFQGKIQAFWDDLFIIFLQVLVFEEKCAWI